MKSTSRRVEPLVRGVNSSPNKHCHWSRISKVPPVDRAANKGHDSSTRSIASPAKKVKNVFSDLVSNVLALVQRQTLARGPNVAANVMTFGPWDNIESLLELLGVERRHNTQNALRLFRTQTEHYFTP